MNAESLKEIIGQLDPSGEPRVELVKHAEKTGARLGVFASSFNPPTLAHVELTRRAAEAFSLDEVIALIGKTNADKLDYECSLEDRLAMLMLAFKDEERVSIGLSSHAFYVDMIDALGRVYEPLTLIHFIVGFDTFERVLDFYDRYTERYYRNFADRREALDYLFARSSFIVAGRAGAGFHSVGSLLEREPAAPSKKVLYLDFPSDLSEVSATEVRKLRRHGLSIKALVPAAVERYVQGHELYLT